LPIRSFPDPRHRKLAGHPIAVRATAAIEGVSKNPSTSEEDWWMENLYGAWSCLHSDYGGMAVIVAPRVGVPLKVPATATSRAFETPGAKLWAFYSNKFADKITPKYISGQPPDMMCGDGVDVFAVIVPVGGTW
jgi:hypothetical protein